MEITRLSAHREAFAQAVASGKTLSDAYRASYNVKKAKPETVNENASRLMADGKVKARVAELRAPAIERVGMTVEGHLRKLQELRDKAEALEEYPAAIKAEELRGKVAGFYVSKTEDVTDPIKRAISNMRPSDAEAMIQALDKVASIREKSKSAA